MAGSVFELCKPVRDSHTVLTADIFILNDVVNYNYHEKCAP